jgi:adenosylhomocysteine nucleosidase
MRRALSVERRFEIDGVNCFAGRQGDRVYWLVATGIGPHAAGEAASTVLDRQRAALAISAGFAGALLPAAAVGDVIAATSVVSGRFDGVWSQVGPPMACDDSTLKAIQAAAVEVGVTVRTGPLVSLATVVWRAVDKQDVSRLAGAIAVDMESAAIGDAARAHGVPFAVLRTVSDVAGEDLPLDFNVFLKPWGWLLGLGAMIMAPSTLGGLNRLRRQSRLAAAKLTAVTAAWSADGFGLSPASEVGRAG